MTKKTTEREVFRTFLSSVSQDRADAEKLRKILLQRKDVKLLAREVSDDQKSQASLSKGLLSADLFVAVLSADALRSQWLLRELGAAWGDVKAILLIKTRPDVSIPVRLAGALNCEMKDAQKPENWNRILDAFKGTLKREYFDLVTRNP